MVYIILVNYNGYSDTIECINSIKRMSYTDYKIVVVDNGSTVAYPIIMENIEEDDNIVILKSKINLGFSGGNNLGIKYALDNDADYILLLNNDTVVTKDFLKAMLQVTIENNNEVVTTSKILYHSKQNVIWYDGGTFNYKTGRTTHKNINKLNEENKTKPENVSFISGCCMLFPSKVIQKIGNMSEKYFLYCEDIDLSCRIIQNGYKMIYVPSSIIYHKVGASSGRVDGMETYYTVRNKFYIVSSYIEHKYKCIAYLYTLSEIVKRCLTREYKIRPVIKGIRDFYRKKTGSILY